MADTEGAGLTVTLHCGDCLDVLKTLEPVDAIVTDPPYGLKFMGKGWDHSVPSVEIWRECFRLLKPGGHLLAFAGTRTQHRMACAIEDAGFEIRDLIAWVYGTGFPKSMNVSKAIDKAAGAEREVIGANPNHRPDSGVNYEGVYAGGNTGGAAITAPATEAAKQWEGWGTALKPALEPITVARKPLEGTVAANVQKHGTGAINVDGCRVESEKPTGWGGKAAGGNTWDETNCGLAKDGKARPVQGRWPANLIHDGSEEAAQPFPDSVTGKKKLPRGTGGIWSSGSGTPCGPTYDGSGSAARFFYCAKASKRERNAGLDGTEQVLVECFIRKKDEAWGSAVQKAVLRADTEQLLQKDTVEFIAANSDASAWSTYLSGKRPMALSQKGCRYTIEMETNSTMRSKILSWLARSITNACIPVVSSLTESGISRAVNAGPCILLRSTMNVKTASLLGVNPAASEMLLRISASVGNVHNTVKPIALMQYLCRLVTPPGGTVLDPFAGSGSTGIAAVREGFDFVGIELSEEYHEIATRRIEADSVEPEPEPEPEPPPEVEPEPVVEVVDEQRKLF